jgi:hypothetical protein
MSRQNKQKRQAETAKWVQGVHKNGNKVPRTKKLSSVNKGKCVVSKGKRISLSKASQKDLD